ncbi:hypothetical protein [Caulobacter sp. Root1472]|uniref:hypothetical protein n=1 Tax=Caulobacter sp. Root1472 TaxID=1736470 RepID=UPI0007008718|nr:hypothetical protein [Caulobacter sp. Root1472]KQZ21684.1 hypothetical protein ASD47_25110 [Caulobacter sp. Root1472]
MVSVQQLAQANVDQPVSKALAALVLAMLTLFIAIVLLVFLGAAPKAAQSPMDLAPSTTAYSSALLTNSPACAAALERAKASKALPGDQAVAANTAMLRACKRP